MRHHPIFLVLVAFLSATACDERSPDPSSAKAEPTPSKPSTAALVPTAPKTPSAAEPAKATTEAKTPDKPVISRAQRALAQRLIHEGRTHSKNKRLDQALASFEASLEANPASATAACEAGFAALRTNDLDKAQHYLEQGLQLVQQPNKEAACRYNLGLVAEKRGNPARAIEHYKHSLSLRENSTVRSKLATLAPDGTCIPPERVLDPTKVACGLPDDYWECGVDEDGRVVEDEHEINDPFPIAEPIGPGMRLVTASAWFGSRMRVELLLERDGRHSLLAELGWNVESLDSSQLRSVQYKHLDLVPGGPSEVVITAKETWETEPSDPAFMDCDEIYESDQPEYQECIDGVDLETETGVSTYFFGCGEIEGRWACGRSDHEPKTAEDFMALFKCGA